MLHKNTRGHCVKKSSKDVVGIIVELRTRLKISCSVSWTDPTILGAFTEQVQEIWWTRPMPTKYFPPSPETLRGFNAGGHPQGHKNRLSSTFLPILLSLVFSKSI